MERLYTTSALALVIQEHVITPFAFLMSMVFTTPYLSDAEEIHFDKLPVTDEIAPYVAPHIPAKAMRDQGFRTEIFKPAYVKPFHMVEPNQHLKRRPGERLGGELSPVERRELHIADLLQRQENSILLRKEQMAWEIMRTGKVVVESDDYPAVVVDFGRDAELQDVLSTTAAWDAEDFDLISHFEDRAAKTQDKCGFAATTHIMTPSAWKLARKNKAFLEALDNRRQPTGSIELGPIALADGDAPKEITGARRVGEIGDQEFYVFDGSYTEGGVRVKFLPGVSCLSLNPKAVEGVDAHGAIMDEESLEPIELFPSMWPEKNPSRTYVMTQSAPLPIPGRINATYFSTIVPNG